jgi:tripartite-type tricarboxylate transporter receptor subunit TctC
MKKYVAILLSSILLSWSVGLSTASAESFPSKSITLYIPYSAGGSTDTSARVLASAAEKILGVPISCVNKTGGGGTVMLGILKNNKPDGYTLGVIPSSAITRTPHMLEVEYDPFQDFDFIMKYGLYTMFLVVNGDSPYMTFSDFVEAARQNPGKISFATPGPMEAGALALQYIGDVEGLNWNMIPFPGSGEGMTALFGNHVNAYSGAGGAETHLAEIEKGDLRVLASYNSVRSPALPDVPTLRDLGYDFAINSGIGIGGPAGIPEDRLKILEKAFLEATESPEFKKVTERLMMPTLQYDQQEFRRTLEEDSKVLGDLLEKMGLQK